jgi:hypothetical protein
MAFDLVIDVENTPGALAQIAAAISDAGARDLGSPRAAVEA